MTSCGKCAKCDQITGHYDQIMLRWDCGCPAVVVSGIEKPTNADHVVNVTSAKEAPPMNRAARRAAAAMVRRADA